MTIADMHRRINLRLQKIDSGAYDNILPEEIDDYINIAQNQFIKSKFEPRSNQFGLGFEQSVKRVEDLKNLIVSKHEIDTVQFDSGFVNGMFADAGDFPADHLFTLSVIVKVFFNSEGLTFTLDTGKRVPDGVLDTDYSEKIILSKFVQQDDIDTILSDPFNKPKPGKSIFTLDENGIVCYSDDTTIVDTIYLSYIRQPAQVSLTGETDSELQFPDEIVDLTVKLILSDIEAFGPEAKFASLNDSE